MRLMKNLPPITYSDQEIDTIVTTRFKEIEPLLLPPGQKLWQQYMELNIQEAIQNGRFKPFFKGVISSANTAQKLTIAEYLKKLTDPEKMTEKIRLADHILDNSTTIGQLMNQIVKDNIRQFGLKEWYHCNRQQELFLIYRPSYKKRILKILDTL
jgi:hypothetical protein